MNDHFWSSGIALDLFFGGIEPADYADDLLHISTASQTGVLAAFMAIAAVRPSRLDPDQARILRFSKTTMEKMPSLQ